jgi:hypothetical protein
VETTKNIKIVAFMTAPRYENTWARNYIEIALRRSGIPLAVSGGVFYGQCMQMMMEQAINDGADVGLTVDFDSVFTKDHIDLLLSKLVFDDKIDAVCAMQCRRGGRTPLASCGEQKQVETDGQPMQVKTAHFGLTAIDLHKLKNVPKPWFWSQPAPDGTWTDAKTDDDIWFWRQWEKAGNSIYMDTNCQIGHLEEVVTHFVEVDGKYEQTHTYPSDWAKQHVN